MRLSICHFPRMAYFFGLFLLSGSDIMGAEPYHPASDTVVLERLPVSLIGSRTEVARLREELSQQRENPTTASRAAGRFLELAKSQNESRFYGYARAALEPWWDLPTPPAEILKVRAKLKESDHQYDQAVADLQLFLDAYPRDVSAWLSLINVLRVQGKYAEANAACDRLATFVTPMIQVLARATIMAVTGDAARAYESLEEVLSQAEVTSPETVPWILTVLSQIANSLGRTEVAEQHYRRGLDIAPENHYLKKDFADFLIDQRRFQEALEVLGDMVSDNDSILLALLASKGADRTDDVRRLRQQLAARLEENRLRGNKPHGRIETRYLLYVEHDPLKGLQVALANWAEQKEIRDSRNVLEAAIAAKRKEEVTAVVQFLQRHKTEDVALKRLLDQWSELP